MNSSCLAPRPSATARQSGPARNVPDLTTAIRLFAKSSAMQLPVNISAPRRISIGRPKAADTELRSPTTAKGKRRVSRASCTSMSRTSSTGALALSPLIMRRSPSFKPSFAASAVLMIDAPLPLSSTARTGTPRTCAETRRVSPVPTSSGSHSR